MPCLRQNRVPEQDPRTLSRFATRYYASLLAIRKESPLRTARIVLGQTRHIPEQQHGIPLETQKRSRTLVLGK